VYDQQAGIAPNKQLALSSIITKDYRSRESGSIRQMLKILQLVGYPCSSQPQLTTLFKVVATGLVPALVWGNSA